VVVVLVVSDGPEEREGDKRHVLYVFSPSLPPSLPPSIHACRLSRWAKKWTLGTLKVVSSLWKIFTPFSVVDGEGEGEEGEERREGGEGCTGSSAGRSCKGERESERRREGKEGGREGGRDQRRRIR